MPSAASAAARLTVSVDLPTPPLPEPTQTTLATRRARRSGSAPRPELLLQAGLLLVGEDVEGDVDAGDAGERADGVRDGGLEVAADRAAGSGQRDGDVDRPVGAGVDRPDHAELDDVLPQLGIDDALERLEDLVMGGHAIHSGKRVAVPRSGRAEPRTGRPWATRSLGRRGTALPARYVTGSLTARGPLRAGAGSGGAPGTRARAAR